MGNTSARYPKDGGSCTFALVPDPITYVCLISGVRPQCKGSSFMLQIAVVGYRVVFLISHLPVGTVHHIRCHLLVGQNSGIGVTTPPIFDILLRANQNALGFQSSRKSSGGPCRRPGGIP